VSRQDSPYVVGDFWLDKRRDGMSPNIWQAATYRKGSRQVVYLSTKCKGVDDAKAWLHAHVDRIRSKQPQASEVAGLVPAIMAYWEEHGRKAERPDSIACSIRHFFGFLIEDGNAGVTIAAADTSMFARFITWRMEPHNYEVDWAGKTYRHRSDGVRGETVHSDLARIGAAINRQIDFGRIPMANKLAKVDKRHRSTAREYLYTVDQLGAIIAVAAMSATDKDGIGMFRWLALQLATACRPEAALAFDARTQYDDAHGLIDLHPQGKARTRKRNPIVPAIDEVRPFLRQWALDKSEPVKSRKRAWRTVRRVLDLPPEAVPKTIRYTVATELRKMGTVPAIQIESLLGHEAVKSVTARYAKYDPNHMAEAKAALSKVFRRVMAAAYQYSAVHRLSKTGNAATILVDRESGKAQIQGRNDGAAYRTRTCDPRITNAGKRGKAVVLRDFEREHGEAK